MLWDSFFFFFFNLARGGCLPFGLQLSIDGDFMTLPHMNYPIDMDDAPLYKMIR